jgi:hypothetical protein
MPTKKDSGLAAIARSTRTTATKQPGRTPASPTAEEKPPLELEGRRHKTSLALDVGLWNCVFDLAHIMTKRIRAMRQGHVNPVHILETAFILFHELSLEEQIELVRRHRDR